MLRLCPIAIPILTLGDLGGAVALIDQNVAALGAEGGRDGLREGLDTVEEGSAALDAELELLLFEAASAYCWRSSDRNGQRKTRLWASMDAYLVGEALLGQVEAPRAQSGGGRGARSRSKHALHSGGVSEMWRRKWGKNKQRHPSRELLGRRAKYEIAARRRRDGDGEEVWC